jgi:hypothetical protein
LPNVRLPCLPSAGSCKRGMALLSGSGRYMDVGSDLLYFYVVRPGCCEVRDNSLELV